MALDNVRIDNLVVCQITIFLIDTVITDEQLAFDRGLPLYRHQLSP